MLGICGVFAILLITIITIAESKSAELRFVSVTFRHGDRAPTHTKEFYPNDPYLHETYYPMGRGGLTNKGKQRAYDLGQVLRKRYNNFLGSVYIPEDIVALSFDVARTKMTLSLVLAGLYPPKSVQQWNLRLNWQPIPITYIPRCIDYLFSTYKCPRYIEELSRVKLLPEIVEKVENFRPFMDNLTIFTGKLINDTDEMFHVYQYLMALTAMDLKLPEWSNDIFPYGALLDGILLNNDIVYYTELLQKVGAGQLLKRFSDDMLASVNGTRKEARKMNLFSCHEMNIVSLLKALGVYEHHVPEYCSAIMIELLQHDGDYYVKVLYYLGIPQEITEVTIPGCDVLCPLDKFHKLLENVMPTNDELDCT